MTFESPLSAVTPGPGVPLSPGVLQVMEDFFHGADLSPVRLHAGPQAQALGALAFARGEDIYFAPGVYHPDSRWSQAVLVHELTHVLQQRAGRVTRARAGLTWVEAPRLEAQAWRQAGAFLRGRRATLDAELLAAPRSPPGIGASRVAQPIVNLFALHPRVDPNKLQGCRRIQQLLRDDDELVLAHLKMLEGEIERCVTGKGGKTTLTARLSQVLQNTEREWMRTGVVTAPADAGVIEVTNFLVDYLWQRRALKDVGARPQHGEFSHRIQWYIIYRAFRAMGAWAQHIRDLYDTIVNPLHSATNMVGVQVSLWDSVLDVRHSWTQGNHGSLKNDDDLKAVYGDVRFASPVFLNETLTSKVPSKWGGEEFQANCPLLSGALKARRAKRVEQFKAPSQEGTSQPPRLAPPTVVIILPLEQQQELVDSGMAHKNSEQES